MAYRKIQQFSRNDLLTAGTYNQLRTNGQLMERVLTYEHGVDGEHNTPFIARTLGTVLVSGGPVYSLSGFNADATLESGHNPTPGQLILTLAMDRYEKDFGALMVQNAGIDGDSRPELTWARWFDDRRVEIFTTTWDSTPNDSAFHIGVHGRQLARSAPLDFGGPLQRRANGLHASNANKLIQASADLQVGMDFAHTEGVHDAREIAKAWAHVQYNGSAFEIVEQIYSDTFDAGGFRSFDIASAGVVNCNFNGSLEGNAYQVFVDVDYSRVSGSSTNYFIPCVPADERSISGFNLYLWKQRFNILVSPAVEEFNLNSVVDFFVWVFDDH